jgi:hypothetical protein
LSVRRLEMSVAPIGGTEIGSVPARLASPRRCRPSRQRQVRGWSWQGPRYPVCCGSPGRGPCSWSWLRYRPGAGPGRRMATGPALVAHSRVSGPASAARAGLWCGPVEWPGLAELAGDVVVVAVAETDYIPCPDITGTAGHEAMPTQSYGNFGLDAPVPRGACCGADGSGREPVAVI